MGCDKYEEMAHLYVDKELGLDESTKLLRHIDSCESCKQYFTELNYIKNSISELPDLEIPAGFHSNLMKKIQHEKSRNNKFSFAVFRNSGKYSIFAASILMLLIVNIAFDYGLNLNNLEAEQNLIQQANNETSYSKTYNTTNGQESQDNNVSENYLQSETSDSVGIMEPTTLNDWDIVKNSTIQLEVDNFDKAVSLIRDFAVSSAYGNVENYSYSNIKDESNGSVTDLKNGYLTLVIPSENYEKTINEVSKSGNVTSMFESNDSLYGQNVLMADYQNKTVNELEPTTTYSTITVNLNERKSESYDNRSGNLITEIKNAVLLSLKSTLKSIENFILFCFTHFFKLILIVLLIIFTNKIYKQKHKTEEEDV